MIRRADFGPRLALGWRVLLAAVALAYGMAAGLVALDRVAAKRADLAPYIPAPFASGAWLSLAREAVAADHGQAAVTYAQAALNASPADGERSGMLGATWLLRRDAAEADKAFLVSARTGWRVIPTQAYMISRAIDTGHYEDAVEHVDALLRQQNALQRSPEVMVQLEGNFNAHDAFLRRLATRPPWLDHYVGEIGGLAPEEIGYRVAVLAELGERGVRLGCEGIDQPVHQLIYYQSYDDARELWNLHCPGSGDSPIYDAHFAQIADSERLATEFRWHLLTSGNLAIDLQDGDHGRGHRIAVTNSGEFPAPFLSQLLVPQPGRYLLRWDGQNAEGKPAKAITAVLSCGHIEPVAGAVGQAEVTFTPDCPATTLTFTIAPGAEPMTLGSVALEPGISG